MRLIKVAVDEFLLEPTLSFRVVPENGALRSSVGDRCGSAMCSKIAARRRCDDEESEVVTEVDSISL